VARAPDGREVEVRAKAFVVAAGAIESARILLEIAEAYPSLHSSLAGVGRFLSDHLSLPIAELADSGGRDLVRLFGPRFMGRWLRRFRFLEVDRPVGSPRGFVHFVFDVVHHPAFALVKELVGAAQERRRPHLSSASLVASIRGLWGLARERYLRSALYVPPDARIFLQLDVEQLPRPENRIVLSEERDRLGRRVPMIAWSVGEADLRAIAFVVERVLDRWPSGRMGLPALRPLPLEVAATKLHDVYHPVGLCRMGKDADGVVDEGLRVHGVGNLWVVSTAVFPSAGSANPTFSMLCLAEDLVERMVELCR
jgi:choline dehydrogenase-like flavoprotein